MRSEDMGPTGPTYGYSGYSSNSGRYDVFLENFNKGNNYLNALTGSFFEQIKVDKQNIINKGSDLIKDRLIQIDELEKDANKTNYQKALVTGTILANIAGEVINASDPLVKKSGINIINSFLNIAKTTEDQQLIDISLRISGNTQI
jgi:hypothetical protein